MYNPDRDMSAEAFDAPRNDEYEGWAHVNFTDKKNMQSCY